MNKHRIKLTRSFYLDEFVDAQTYRQYGSNSIWFIDRRVVLASQLVRDLAGVPTTINNWWNSGTFQFSGYRPPTAKIGATKSQHRSGRAVDLKVRGMNGEQMFELVTNNWREFAAIGITTLENPEHTPTWLHLDCRQLLAPRPDPLVVYP